MPTRACLFRGPDCSDGGHAVPGGSRCRAHGGGRKPFAGAKQRYRRLPEPIRQAVLERDGRRCTRCGARERLEVDHIQPQS
jgi:5-methylcytosine-specific restriction endonuclease McrA